MEYNLNSEYWSERYKKDSIPWDLGTISEPLKKYIDQLKNKDIKILIPGCGNAYEAFYLMEQGFKNVSCLDFSKDVLDKIKQKNSQINCFSGDFFSHIGEYDLILEQTFFCALAPNLRTHYVEHIFKLLRTKGKLVGLLFDRDFESGPPFGGSIEEYRLLFSKLFTITTLEKSYNSIPQRIECFINIEKN
jgi:SAM-dependent methyltransferase